MVNVPCELVWVRHLLTNAPECPMRLHCDNQVVLHIDENPIFYERTKHIEVDCHLIRQKIEEKVVQA